MATGHAVTGPGLPESTLDRNLADPKVNAILKSPFKIDRDHDVPYLGGVSKDGKTVYIDRHLPNTLDISGRKISVLPFLLTHERTEWALMEAKGYSYEAAHELATIAEHRKVKASGLKPSAYERAIQRYVKADEKAKIQKPPADLDSRPYLQESDPESRELWRHIQGVHGHREDK